MAIEKLKVGSGIKCYNKYRENNAYGYVTSILHDMGVVHVRTCDDEDKSSCADGYFDSNEVCQNCTVVLEDDDFFKD